MLYALGSLIIDVEPFNVDRVSEQGSTDYAVKSVAGVEPPLEFVGEGGNEMTLSGRLFPRALGGLNELELLRQLRTSGKAQYLMRGDGRPMGWFAILSVSTNSEYLDGRGVGQQIAVQINLRRASKPADRNFFSLMSGLIGQ